MAQSTASGRSSRSRGSLVAMVAVAALASSVISGCGFGRADPGDAARSLADGIEAGDVSGVPMLSGGKAAQKDFSRIIDGLGDEHPAVTVGDVIEDGDKATAVLSTSWKFDQTVWAYKTRAHLTHVGDRWEVDWAPAIVAPKLGQDERLSLRSTSASRADILGAAGAALVTEREVVRVGIDKTKTKPDQTDGSAESLARLLDISVANYQKRVKAAGPQAFVEALVLRAGPSYPFDDAQITAIPGAVQIRDELPLAPTREFAQPLLGTVGEATAEIIKDSRGKIRAGDMVGLSGLQKRYDDQLRGLPGLEVTAISSKAGVKQRVLFSSESRAGKALRTTIDPTLQRAADDILTSVKPASAIVAIRPSTGDVLALASGPGGKGYATASLGRYAPGSSFKVVTALTFLRSGLTQKSIVPCTKSLTVDGRQFENYDAYPASRLGNIPLRSAMANSCNTAMIAKRALAPQPKLADAAAALGLGQDFDLGLPAFLGSVPTKASGTEHAASMIGQGRIEASPLSMATVAASIAHGQRVTPKLLPDYPSKAVPNVSAKLTSGEAEQLRAMIRAVVTEGSGGFLADIPGGPVSAKTGTAEYGTDNPPRTHAWMIATQGDLAVAVFVEDGASGSGTAGPLLESFLRGIQ